MKILGIDPGSQIMGLGCIESRGSALACIGHRIVRVQKLEWAERLKAIFLAVQESIKIWQPEAVAIEEVFFAKNAQSALKLGQARGAALAAVAVLDLPVFGYSPTQVKQSVAASGRADKDQIFSMVKLLLGKSLAALPELERHDASDALALAICHSQHMKHSKHLQIKQQEHGAQKPRKVILDL